MDKGTIAKSAPKVSVVMPVYNTALFVGDAIQCIINQTLSDIEIIVVNDGSTDNSLQIIEKMAFSNPRIKIYSQSNKGQATARNKGLELAIGEYVYLMDSDDLLDENTFFCCYERCKKDHLDFVFFDAEYLSNYNKLNIGIDYNRKRSVREDIIYNGIDLLSHLIKTGKYRVPPWLNFIKRSYIEHNQLSFVPGLLHEDQIFTTMLFIQAQQVGYIAQPFFKRRLRENSIMTNKYSMKNIDTYYTVVDYLRLYAKGKDHKTELVINQNIRFIFDPAIYLAKSLSFRERISVLKRCLLRYRMFVSIKSYTVIMFPFLVKIKSLFK